RQKDATIRSLSGQVGSLLAERDERSANQAHVRDGLLDLEADLDRLADLPEAANLQHELQPLMEKLINGSHSNSPQGMPMGAPVEQQPQQQPQGMPMGAPVEQQPQQQPQGMPMGAPVEQQPQQQPQGMPMGAPVEQQPQQQPQGYADGSAVEQQPQQQPQGMPMGAPVEQQPQQQPQGMPMGAPAEQQPQQQRNQSHMPMSFSMDDSSSNDAAESTEYLKDSDVYYDAVDGKTVEGTNQKKQEAQQENETLQTLQLKAVCSTRSEMANFPIEQSKVIQFLMRLLVIILTLSTHLNKAYCQPNSLNDELSTDSTASWTSLDKSKLEKSAASVTEDDAQEKIKPTKENLGSRVNQEKSDLIDNRTVAQPSSAPKPDRDSFDGLPNATSLQSGVTDQIRLDSLSGSEKQSTSESIKTESSKKPRKKSGRRRKKNKKSKSTRQSTSDGSQDWHSGSTDDDSGSKDVKYGKERKEASFEQSSQAKSSGSDKSDEASVKKPSAKRSTKRDNRQKASAKASVSGSSMANQFTDESQSKDTMSSPNSSEGHIDSDSPKKLRKIVSDKSISHSSAVDIVEAKDPAEEPRSQLFNNSQPDLPRLSVERPVDPAKHEQPFDLRDTNSKEDPSGERFFEEHQQQADSSEPKSHPPMSGQLDQNECDKSASSKQGAGPSDFDSGGPNKQDPQSRLAENNPRAANENRRYPSVDKSESLSSSSEGNSETSQPDELRDNFGTQQSDRRQSQTSENEPEGDSRILPSDGRQLDATEIGSRTLCSGQPDTAERTLETLSTDDNRQDATESRSQMSSSAGRLPEASKFNSEMPRSDENLDLVKKQSEDQNIAYDSSSDDISQKSTTEAERDNKDGRASRNKSRRKQTDSRAAPLKQFETQGHENTSRDVSEIGTDESVSEGLVPKSGEKEGAIVYDEQPISTQSVSGSHADHSNHTTSASLDVEKRKAATSERRDDTPWRSDEGVPPAVVRALLKKLKRNKEIQQANMLNYHKDAAKNRKTKKRRNRTLIILNRTVTPKVVSASRQMSPSRRVTPQIKLKQCFLVSLRLEDESVSPSDTTDQAKAMLPRQLEYESSATRDEQKDARPRQSSNDSESPSDSEGRASKSAYESVSSSDAKDQAKAMLPRQLEDESVSPSNTTDQAEAMIPHQLQDESFSPSRASKSAYESVSSSDAKDQAKAMLPRQLEDESVSPSNTTDQAEAMIPHQLQDESFSPSRASKSAYESVSSSDAKDQAKAMLPRQLEDESVSPSNTTDQAEAMIPHQLQDESFSPSRASKSAYESVSSSDAKDQAKAMLPRQLEDESVSPSNTTDQAEAMIPHQLQDESFSPSRASKSAYESVSSSDAKDQAKAMLPRQLEDESVSPSNTTDQAKAMIPHQLQDESVSPSDTTDQAEAMLSHELKGDSSATREERKDAHRRDISDDSKSPSDPEGRNSEPADESVSPSDTTDQAEAMLPRQLEDESVSPSDTTDQAEAMLPRVNRVPPDMNRKMLVYDKVRMILNLPGIRKVVSASLQMSPSHQVTPQINLKPCFLVSLRMSPSRRVTPQTKLRPCFLVSLNMNRVPPEMNRKMLVIDKVRMILNLPVTPKVVPASRHMSPSHRVTPKTKLRPCFLVSLRMSPSCRVTPQIKLKQCFLMSLRVIRVPPEKNEKMLIAGIFRMILNLPVIPKVVTASLQMSPSHQVTPQIKLKPCFLVSLRMSPSRRVTPQIKLKPCFLIKLKQCFLASLRLNRVPPDMSRKMLVLDKVRMFLILKVVSTSLQMSPSHQVTPQIKLKPCFLISLRMSPSRRVTPQIKLKQCFLMSLRVIRVPPEKNEKMLIAGTFRMILNLPVISKVVTASLQMSPSHQVTPQIKLKPCFLISLRMSPSRRVTPQIKLKQCFLMSLRVIRVPPEKNEKMPIAGIFRMILNLPVIPKVVSASLQMSTFHRVTPKTKLRPCFLISLRMSPSRRVTPQIKLKQCFLMSLRVIRVPPEKNEKMLIAGTFRMILNLPVISKVVTASLQMSPSHQVTPQINLKPCFLVSLRMSPSRRVTPQIKLKQCFLVSLRVNRVAPEMNRKTIIPETFLLILIVSVTPKVEPENLRRSPFHRVTPKIKLKPFF
uniref:Protein piccolo n=1 Tax=Macrostomum lignano TaxID=282301 RepID=A0A1I8GX79_9PLAT